MTTKYIYRAAILFAVSLLAAACNDVVTYNDDYDDLLTSFDVPRIDSVVNTQDISRAVTEGDFKDMITIYGSNLAEVKSLLLNDVEVDLKTIYAIRNQITLPIPAKAPSVTSNQLRVSTRLGEASFPFTVNIPPLVVKGFVNDFAANGDTAVVQGDFFDAYDITMENGVFQLQGTAVKMLEVTNDRLSFVIPEGTPDDAVFSVSSSRLTEPVELRIRHKGYPILNYEDLSENEVGSTYLAYVSDGTAEGDPKPLVGKFTRVRDSWASYAWKVLMYGKFSLPDVDIKNNPENYLVKFEINTAADRSLSVGNIYVGRAYNSALSYKWNPASDGISRNTFGKWETVSFEVTDLFRESAEGGTNLVEGRNNFYFIYQPTKAISVDLSVCNFRFVKK